MLAADDGQATALVPLTDEQEDAMETTIFQELLRCCGLYPPPTEQVCCITISSDGRTLDEPFF